jgi:hypothetical protein
VREKQEIPVLNHFAARKNEEGLPEARKLAENSENTGGWA